MYDTYIYEYIIYLYKSCDNEKSVLWFSGGKKNPECF